MSVYVVDTSVVVKWFNDRNEQDMPQARALLRDAVDYRITLFTSDLLLYELANALALGKRIVPGVVRSVIERLGETPVAFVNHSPAIFELAADFAQRYKISVYDSVYVAVAAEIDATLVTANPRHQGRVSEIPVLPLSRYRSSSE